jgi:hypothetical protein
MFRQDYKNFTALILSGLILAKNARNLPLKGSHTRGRLHPCLPTFGKMEVAGSDEHTCLQLCIVEHIQGGLGNI